IVAAIGIAGLFLYPRFKRVTQEAPKNHPATSVVVDMSVDRVHALLLAAYSGYMEPGFKAVPDGTYGSLPVWFKLYPAGNYIFPEDYQLNYWTSRDPELKAYVGTPAVARAKDFYLWNSGDRYWVSEYRYKGQPAPFHSYFIVHLEPAKGSSTRIQVLEY